MAKAIDIARTKPRSTRSKLRWNPAGFGMRALWCTARTLNLIVQKQRVATLPDRELCRQRCHLHLPRWPLLQTRCCDPAAMGVRVGGDTQWQGVRIRKGVDRLTMKELAAFKTATPAPAPEPSPPPQPEVRHQPLFQPLADGCAKCPPLCNQQGRGTGGQTRRGATSHACSTCWTIWATCMLLRGRRGREGVRPAEFTGERA